MCLTCLLLGHRMRVVQEFTAISRKLQCRRCEKYYAMNDTMGIVSWDDDAERIYKRISGGPTYK